MKQYEILLNLNPPQPDIRQIYRYLLCNTRNEETDLLISQALSEANDTFSYSLLYKLLDIRTNGSDIDLGFTKVVSTELSKNLENCSKAILFAATVGGGIDRLIAKYKRISPSKSAVLQAIGSERAEALCNCFSKHVSDKAKLVGYLAKPRFSCGYGDLSLTLQKEIIDTLDATKRIGITLTDSYLMLPTKSVTAFIGLYKKEVI